MHLLGQQKEEMRNIVQKYVALNKIQVNTSIGVVKRYPKSKEARERFNELRRQLRKAYYAQGLTSEGKIRKRPHEDLSGLTEEQKKLRAKQQRYEWRKSQEKRTQV